MSDERVERIARVLNQADAGNIGVNTWNHINEPTREEYRHMARAVAALDEEPPLESEKVARLRAQVGRLQHAIHIHNRDRLRVTLQLDDMGQLPPLDMPPIAEERNGLLFGDLRPLEDDDVR